MTWLQDIRWPGGPDDRVLILCRTSASKALVLRHIAEQGGQLGAHVTTIHALAMQLAGVDEQRSPDREDPDLDCPLWRRIGNRPELQKLALGWAEAATSRGVGEKVLGPEMATLRQRYAAKLPGPLPLQVLAKKAAEYGSRLGGELDFARIYAVGFGDGAAADPAKSPKPWAESDFVPTILKGLGASFVAHPRQRRAAEVPVWQATDVAAEARWVAFAAEATMLLPKPASSILVLTANREDEARIRAALQRSNIPVSAPSARPLRHHALSALVRKIAPWFGAESPQVSGRLFLQLVRFKLLKRTWVHGEDTGHRTKNPTITGTTKIEAALKEAGLPAPASDKDKTFSRSSANAALRACHLVSADIPTWVAALTEVASRKQPEPAREWERRTAVHIAAALRWLQRCRERETTESGVPSVAAVGAFLRGFGVAGVDGTADFVGQRILSKLSKRADLPATEEHVDEALAGNVGTGALGEGVTLLAYDDYDHRDTDTLLLTGLHSGALGSTPSPDPFLSDAQLAALGDPRGERLLRFRQAQLAEAVLRAKTCVGCVVERDATGRNVAPWLRLDPEVAAGVVLQRTQDVLDNYGLSAENPETRDIRKLSRHLLPVPQPPAAEAGYSEQAALAPHHRAAHAATVEWVRAGSHHAEYVAPPEPKKDAEKPPPQTLQHILARYQPAIPQHTAAWVGAEVRAANAGLDPNEGMSVSSVFEPMSRCSYQLFAKRSLRLRAERELADELDARELGTIAHNAMEKVGADTRWRVKEGEKPAAVKALTDALNNAMAEQMALQTGRTPGLQAAEKAQLERWQTHWARYVQERVEVLDDGGRAQGKALGQATGHPSFAQAWELVVALTAELAPNWTAKGRPADLKTWLKAAVAHVAAGGNLHDDQPMVISKKPSGKWRPTVAQTAKDPGLVSLVAEIVAVYGDALPKFEALDGPIVGGLPEWSFGQYRDGSGTACEIELDGEKALVRGSVDLVRVTGSKEKPALHVVDYKTWKGKEYRGDLQAGIEGGVEPQLPLYALVAKKKRRENPEISALMAADPLAVTLAYDRVRHAKKDDGTRPVTDGVEIDLHTSEQLLGGLLKQARAAQFPVLPHPDKCPKTGVRGAYCDFGDICRFRMHAGAKPYDLKDDEEGTT